MNEGFEMRDLHRGLLSKNRTYLLHNLRPTETFWSTLQVKDILSEDMVDDVKSRRMKSEQISAMLDYLPARGPNAFDQFCEALLECDHPHVAEYLKTLEATDCFRKEISPHCQDLSDTLVDRFVAIYKHSAPVIKRFAERRHELMLEEQGRDLQQREDELHAMEGQLSRLQLETSQVNSFINVCATLGEELVTEIRGDFLSRSYLKECNKYLGTLKEQLRGIIGFEKICGFYSNMQEVLEFLETHGAGIQPASKSGTFGDGISGNGGDPGRARSARRAHGLNSLKNNGASLQEKMEAVAQILNDVITGIGNRGYVQGVTVRTELERAMVVFRELMSDMQTVKDALRKTYRQKRKLESEVLSMVHNFQEIRRLEREVKEKQSHIAELNREGQMLRKKARQQHRKQIDTIHVTVEQKRIQLRELQKALERHLGSADVRLHSLVTLLPDLDQNDNHLRSDTELSSDASRCSSRIQTACSDGNGNRGGHVYGTAGAPSSRSISGEGQPVSEPSRDSQQCEADEATTAGGITPGSTQPRGMDIGGGTTASDKPQPRAASRLLDRRQQQQPLVKRTATGAASTRNKVVNGGSNVTRLKYSRPGTKPPPSTDLKREATEVPNSKLTSARSPDGDKIEDWVARQKGDSRVEELHRKLANFEVVEAEDRTEEIRKLGKTLEETDEQTKSGHAWKVPPESKEEVATHKVNEAQDAVPPELVAGYVSRVSPPAEGCHSPGGRQGARTAQGGSSGMPCPAGPTADQRRLSHGASDGTPDRRCGGADINGNSNGEDVAVGGASGDGSLAPSVDKVPAAQGARADLVRLEGDRSDVRMPRDSINGATTSGSDCSAGHSVGAAAATRTLPRVRQGEGLGVPSSARQGEGLGSSLPVRQGEGLIRQSVSSLLTASNTTESTQWPKKVNPRENRGVFGTNVIELRLPSK